MIDLDKYYPEVMIDDRLCFTLLTKGFTAHSSQLTAHSFTDLNIRFQSKLMLL